MATRAEIQAKLAAIDQRKADALKALQAKKLKLKAKLAQLDRPSKSQRRLDARRKILLGAFVLEQLQRTGGTPQTLTFEGQRFFDWLVRPNDRAVFEDAHRQRSGDPEAPSRPADRHHRHPPPCPLRRQGPGQSLGCPLAARQETLGRPRRPRARTVQSLARLKTRRKVGRGRPACIAQNAPGSSLAGAESVGREIRRDPPSSPLTASPCATASVPVSVPSSLPEFDLPTPVSGFPSWSPCSPAKLCCRPPRLVGGSRSEPSTGRVRQLQASELYLNYREGVPFHPSRGYRFTQVEGVPFHPG